MDNIDFHIISNGGVASAKGFRAGGIHAGFRKDPHRLDMALVVAKDICPVAATFTQNVFCAAPIIVSKDNLDNQGFGLAKAIVINSGIANAATGYLGIIAAQETTEIVAQELKCAPDDILVASTGLIGPLLEVEPFKNAIATLNKALQNTETRNVDTNAYDNTCVLGTSGLDAAKAIMTTDTVPKQCALSWTSKDKGFENTTFTIGGMSKGSGMIMPNMATMIAVFTTDAPLSPMDLHSLLVNAVNKSFNKITVDSDTSTNDCCFLMASGSASTTNKTIQNGSVAYKEFQLALNNITQILAREMVRDGEGATKLIEVTITGAATKQDAEHAARTVANSPLVKTAIYGHDANWGRIAAALGRSGASFNQENVAIDIMGIAVLRDGLPIEFDEEEALKRFQESEIVIEANLGAGSYSDTMWTCDFSHDYITINGDYRT